MGRLTGAARAMLIALVFLAPPLGAQQNTRKPSRPSLDSLVRRAHADSNDAVAHYDLAMGYWRRMRWEEAERSLHEAVALAPQYAEAYLALAALPYAQGGPYWRRLEKRLGQPGVLAVRQTSARFYRRAFLVNPMVDLALMGHVDETSYVYSGEYRMRVWWLGPLGKSVNYLTDGDYPRARGLLAAILAHQRAGADGVDLPDEVLWYHGLACAHLQRYDEAVEDFTRLERRAEARTRTEAIGITPLEANDYRYALATVLYLAARYDDATVVFRRAVEADIALYPAHVQLARIAEARQDWDTAVRERQAAIDASPDDPGLVTDLGVTLMHAGRLEEAAEAFAQAMAAAPREPRDPYLAGIVALRLDRKDAAREAFDRFVRIAPSRFAPQVAEARDQLRALDSAR
jgi:tetratricopeptide (TPR) repeat protein